MRVLASKHDRSDVKWEEGGNHSNELKPNQLASTVRFSWNYEMRNLKGLSVSFWFFLKQRLNKDEKKKKPLLWDWKPMIKTNIHPQMQRLSFKSCTSTNRPPVLQDCLLTCSNWNFQEGGARGELGNGWGLLKERVGPKPLFSVPLEVSSLLYSVLCLTKGPCTANSTITEWKQLQEVGFL